MLIHTLTKLIKVMVICACLTAPAKASQLPVSDQVFLPFDLILKSHTKQGVKNGVQLTLVDYQALSKAPGFATIENNLQDLKPQAWSRQQQLAFYINAYNYFAIKMVLAEPDIKSIRDRGNFLFPVWGKTIGKIAGKEVTLEYIEHQVLRLMDEPRIHFAIVCASVSCPDLRQEIYTAEKLEQQLQEQTFLFLSNGKKGLRVEGNTWFVSKIFSWFEEDFDSVTEFIAQYRLELEAPKKLRYLNYDWDLNRL